jgi:hypothetical protein
MMTGRAAETGVSGRDERVRDAATVPMSDREKDVEILALRHQIAVLERQLNGQPVRFHAIEHANRRIRSPPCG